MEKSPDQVLGQSSSLCDRLEVRLAIRDDLEEILSMEQDDIVFGLDYKEFRRKVINENHMPVVIVEMKDHQPSDDEIWAHIEKRKHAGDFFYQLDPYPHASKDLREKGVHGWAFCDVSDKTVLPISTFRVHRDVLQQHVGTTLMNALKRSEGARGGHWLFRQRKILRMLLEGGNQIGNDFLHSQGFKTTRWLRAPGGDTVELTFEL